MTWISKKTGKLTQEEREEMNAIRNALGDSPKSVHPDKMEQYTQYLVRSMKQMETVTKVS